jgi:hypothetical protein
MCYSLLSNAPTMLPAGSLEAEELRFQTTGRQHRGCIIPQAVTHSLVFLKMGKIISPKHVELMGIINKLLLLHLVGFL